MYKYPYGDSQQLNLDWILAKLKELEASAGSGGADLEEVSNALIALTYNPNTLYARYDYAFLNNKLYRCLSGTSGAFDPDAWQEALIGDDLAVLTRWINALDAAAVVDVKFDTSGTNGKIQQKYNNAYHDVVEVDYTPVQNSKRPLSSNAGYDMNTVINAITNPFTNYNVAGKHLWIYRFGGGGNNWCWVRTPESYDPQRKTKFPFVVCNHGNGWVMDGTEQYANYTKRTMYVPLDDPDYINNPTQYNGTADSSLWYSNPTIEALLAAGYVVCGAENYGDMLYGNENCRNSCVHFINHMIDVYNVEHRCSMIGASAGALTTLNAAYIAPDKIKSIILQYPVTCLVNQYDANSSQRASIRTAYGISDAAITLDDLATVVATHDPLTSAVVNGIRADNLPPIKIWYSTGDTVALYNVNTIPFFNLLKTSNKVCELVQASGNHGDYTHFDPAATVAWFNQPESSVAAYSPTGMQFYNIESLIAGVTIHAYKFGRIVCMTVIAYNVVAFNAGWNNLSQTLPEEIRTEWNNPPTNTTFDEMRSVFKAGTVFGQLSIVGGTLRLNFTEATSTSLIASIAYPSRG